MLPPPSGQPAARGPARCRRPARAALAGLLSTGTALATALAGVLAPALPVQAAPVSSTQLQALEAALNSASDQPLSALLQAGPGFDPGRIEEQRRRLRASFPDARWSLSPGTPRRDGRPTVRLSVTGSRLEGGQRFRLQADQLLSLESDGRRITGETILQEQSLLRSGDTDLPVTVQIPDAVLTGQRYDVDVIFDDPLEGALTAGGIVAVTPGQVVSLDNPGIEIGALGGGGLFKTVRAPLNPGVQTWAVLLVHPRGVVTATRRVRVEASKAALTP